MVIGLQEAITIVSIIAGIAGIVTAIRGVKEYSRSITFRRAEWLYSLYRDFYVQPHLKEIREELDSKEGRTRIELLIQKERLIGDEEKLLSGFTDYLNFFEFMIYLRKIGALKGDDIKAMFDYYLELLHTSEPIVKYMSKAGYEHLAGYLERYEYRK